MEYYKLLNLRKEPFSTSPDPAFFYYSYEHKECLNRLEIALRLRRGLSVILGDVGTGKTTICRMLIQKFAQEKENFIIRLILDPMFKSEFEFLKTLSDSFGIDSTARSSFEYKNDLQNFLLQKGAAEKKIVVLLIDEGQKLTPTYIEVLRTLLNYETNEFKLLQLVIFAQQEFLHKMKRQPNFLDRVSLGYVINPLNEEDTKGLIKFRLKTAGLNSEKILFTEKAMKLIYIHTQGFPRRITTFCHDALIKMLREDKKVVDEKLVLDIIRNEVNWYAR
ncbi:transposase [candidate division KSB1 bacterium]|nr:MAG: transposase [candidate division KSB1 bacterium]